MVALMVESALAALLFCDREQGRLRTCGRERLAQSRHAVGEPSINGVESRCDMGGAKLADPALLRIICRFDRAADLRFSSNWGRGDRDRMYPNCALFPAGWGTVFR